MARMGKFLLLAMFGICISAQLIAGQAPAPGPDCTNELIELLPCLDFLSNSSVTTVAPACCSGLKNASSNLFCLCTIITGNQTAQLGVNDTRAFELPSLCSLNLNPNRCPAILGTPAPSPAFGPVASPVPIAAPVPISPAPVSLAPGPSAGTPSITPILSPESSASPSPLADCTSEITLLAPCLGFVTGTATSPSPGCCTSLGDVVNTHPQCLCSLATSANTMGVNSTRVTELPELCKVPVTVASSIGDCGAAAPSVPGSEAPGSPEGSYGTKSAATSSLHVVIAVFLGTFARFLPH